MPEYVATIRVSIPDVADEREARSITEDIVFLLGLAPVGYEEPRVEDLAIKSNQGSVI